MSAPVRATRSRSGFARFAIQRKVRPLAIALGIVTGQALAIALYVQQVDFGGINLGLVSLCVNLLVIALVNYAPRLARVQAS